jgi:hypothetical protein
MPPKLVVPGSLVHLAWYDDVEADGAILGHWTGIVLREILLHV